jgi:hypothetical protein
MGKNSRGNPKVTPREGVREVWITDAIGFHKDGNAGTMQDLSVESLYSLSRIGRGYGDIKTNMY